uniref:Uncharacterized protein n=2 Tax=Aegilops tauschii subsp. strangulata TaxID=200361 RepID=A0A453AKE9_AEGTS
NKAVLHRKVHLAMPRASAAVNAGQVTTLLYQKLNSSKRIFFSWLILACFGCRYDAGGEGACLKRYTDPSFFRAHSAQHESDLQSSDNHSKPPAKEAHHNKYSKFKTGALSDMLQQLKYRHMIRRKRRQKHNFQNQGSSQDEASEPHVLSSADSPEASNSEAPCPAVPANKERSSDLVDRTSSFGAWLSPSAACCTDACENTPDNTDGSSSHGTNKADENANNATNSRSPLVDFIASRVESSPSKLSVKKHSDPLTKSFRNMAKKLLLEYESAENFRNSNLVHSEDVPDPDEVAFYSKTTKDTHQDAATSEQSDDPCE